MILRPYQYESFKSVQAAFAAGHRCVLLVMPTGAGKTVLFSFAAEGWAASGDPVLIAAHRRELIRQASSKLEIPHGIIAAGIPGTTHATQVGSIQTLGRRLDRIPQFRRIILDEAHHAVAGQWRALLDSQPNARVLGVTATPERLDGRGLGDVFTAIVIGPTVAELIRDGYLSDYVCFRPPRAAPDITRMHILAGDFNPAEVKEVMDKPSITGDAVEHYGQHAAGLGALVFCCSVRHAENVAREFQREGWNFVAVHGGRSEAARDQAIADLGAGRIAGITSCSLIDEGLDVPGVACVIDLSPTASLGRFLQRGGRGLRPIYSIGFDLLTRQGRLDAQAAGPKPRMVLLDHAGNTWRHGSLHRDRDWTLDSPKRKPKTSAGMRQCVECYAIHEPAPTCPVCGFDYAAAAAVASRNEIERRKGELEKMSPEDQRIVYLRETTLAILVSEADTYGGFAEIAAARNYHPGWVDRQMAMRPRLRRERTYGREFEGR